MQADSAAYDSEFEAVPDPGNGDLGEYRSPEATAEVDGSNPSGTASDRSAATAHDFAAMRETPLCQRWDSAKLTIALPAETEEWADDALREADLGEVRRDEYGVLIVEQQIGGNCGAVQTAAGWLREIEDALSDCDVDASHLILRIEGLPGTAK